MRNWVIAPARSTSSKCNWPLRGARRDVGSEMRRRVPLSILAVYLVVAGASMGLAQTRQYPIFTADHLHLAMKTVGLAFDLVRHSIEKNDPELAKDYLVRARDQLATTITFWRDRKVEDAIAILRDNLKKMDALDTAISVAKDKMDMPAVVELAKQVNTSCEACHARYREQDTVSKEYRVKPELLKP
jgi:hypothetical protein